MISVYKDFDDVPKGLENGDLTEAKKRLREIYHGKCAYTEQKISEEETYILRYRPVSEYPWLEFEWSNLLPVCKMVFERLKNKPFKIHGKKVKNKPENKEDFKADSELMLKEEPLLLNPEVDTIENYFYCDLFEGIFHGYNQKGKDNIDIFKLNQSNLINIRKSILKEISEEVKGLYLYYEKYFKSNKFEKKTNSIKQISTLFFENILDKAEDRKEYSFIVKYLIENFGEFTGEFGGGDAFFWMEIETIGEELSFPNPLYINENNKSFFYENDLLRVLEIHIQKYFLIKRIKIQFPNDTRWVFFTGENGFGKSLLLQSIYLSIASNNEIKIDNNSRFVIHFYASSGNCKHIVGINKGYDSFSSIEIEESTVAYGANRLNLSGYINEDERTQAPQKVNKSDSLFKNDGTLYNIEAYLTKMHGREQYKKRIEIIKKVLIELLPSVAAIEIDDSEVDKKVYYREKAENGDLLNRIRFHQLSAGNKSIIAMVGDMLTEFYEGQPDVTNPQDFVGIVLIDEIDAHLHPKWQRELVIKLTELFPKVQFIASTHSPIPLLGAPKETVIFNVEKPDRKTGIQVRKLDIDVSQLTPNTILSSPIFGFDEIIPKSRDKNKKSYTEDEYEEVIFEKKMDTVLRKLATMEGKTIEELINE